MAVSASFQQEIPVLPVVIPLGIAVSALLLWRLGAKELFSIPRALVAAALGIYAAGIVGNTIFPIYLHPLVTSNPFTDFDDWMQGIVFVPFADYEFMDFAINALVFLPLGMLFSLLFTKPSWWKVLLAVTATSLGIELTQLVTQSYFGGGHIADSSDLVSNVVGGVAGYLLLVILCRLPWFARFADRFRWSVKPTGSAASR